MLMAVLRVSLCSSLLSGICLINSSFLDSLNSDLCLLNAVRHWLCLGSFSLFYSLEALSGQSAGASIGLALFVSLLLGVTVHTACCPMSENCRFMCFVWNASDGGLLLVVIKSSPCHFIWAGSRRVYGILILSHVHWTCKWRCQVGNQIYEFGIQERDSDWRYTSIISIYRLLL